jgi:hypothetical protein
MSGLRHVLKNIFLGVSTTIDSRHDYDEKGRKSQLIDEKRPKITAYRREKAENHSLPTRKGRKSQLYEREKFENHSLTANVSRNR